MEAATVHPAPVPSATESAGFYAALRVGRMHGHELYLVGREAGCLRLECRHCLAPIRLSVGPWGKGVLSIGTENTPAECLGDR